MKWLMVVAAAVTLSAAGATKWTLAHLSDGQPDLQGYWTNATYTPLERDRDLGTKEFFTPAEAAAYAKKRADIENSQPKDNIHYDDRIWQDENYGKVLSRNRTSLIYDPPDGRIPDLTPAAKAIVAARAAEARLHGPSDAADSRSLGERCISWGNEGPPMVGSTYQANLQIVQTKSQFVIRHEIMHGVRIIPVDNSPHVSKNVRMLFGDSRGRWEGDTLVPSGLSAGRELRVPAADPIGRVRRAREDGALPIGQGQGRACRQLDLAEGAVEPIEAHNGGDDALDMSRFVKERLGKYHGRTPVHEADLVVAHRHRARLHDARKPRGLLRGVRHRQICRGAELRSVRLDDEDVDVVGMVAQDARQQCAARRGILLAQPGKHGEGGQQPLNTAEDSRLFSDGEVRQPAGVFDRVLAGPAPFAHLVVDDDPEGRDDHHEDDEDDPRGEACREAAHGSPQ